MVHKLNFAAAINEDDDGCGRDAQMNWWSYDNNTWQYPDSLGDCKLQ